MPPVQEIQRVGQGGGPPSSPLVVELLELLRGVGVGVGGRVVLHPPALLQQQRAQPAVLACDTHARVDGGAVRGASKADVCYLPRVCVLFH